MKKNTSKLLLLMMVLVMSIGLAACGSDKDSQKDTKASQVSQKKGNAPYDSISDFLNSDVAKKTFDSLKKNMEGTGMNLELTAEGDKLIYTYTYEEIEKTDEMAEQLEQAMASQDSTLKSTANSVKQSVNSDTVTVVIRYVDCNGQEIYSKEYVSD